MVWGALAYQWLVVVGMASHILEDLLEKSDLEPGTGVSWAAEVEPSTERGKHMVRP